MLYMLNIDIKSEKKTDFRMFQYIWLLKVVKVEGRQVLNEMVNFCPDFDFGGKNHPKLAWAAILFHGGCILAHQ